MTERLRLAQRRCSSTRRLLHHGVAYTATFGFYTDGTIGEVFIDSGKIGSEAAHLAQDVAVLISLALQHQVPLGTLQMAMGRTSRWSSDRLGEPHSIAGAVLDLLVAEACHGQP